MPGAPGSFGLLVSPEAAPEVQIELVYNMSPIGMCGTGVTFTPLELESGYAATLADERNDSFRWVRLIFEKPYELYSASCFTTPELWNKYETEIVYILNTLRLGGDL